MTSVGVMASAVVPPSAGTDVLLEPFNNFTFAPWTNTSCTIVTGRNGNGANIPAAGNIVYTIPTINQSAALTIGFAWRTNALAAAQSFICELLSDAGATTHNRLYVDNGGSVGVTRGTSTDLVTTSPTNTILINTWYYLELQITLHDTAGALTVRKNGAVLLTGTALDTKNAGTKTVYDTVRLRSAATTTMLTDDLYITMGAGAAFKGDIVVP